MFDIMLLEKKILHVFFLMQFPWGKRIIKLGARKTSPCKHWISHFFLNAVVQVLSFKFLLLNVLFCHSPLTTVRDNLMIKLKDAEGNEISRTGLIYLPLSIMYNIYFWFHFNSEDDGDDHTSEQKLRPYWWSRKVIGTRLFQWMEVGSCIWSCNLSLVKKSVIKSASWYYISLHIETEFNFVMAKKI